MNNFTEENLIDYTEDVYTELLELGYDEKDAFNDEFIADEFIKQTESTEAAYALYLQLLDEKDESTPYVDRKGW